MKFLSVGCVAFALSFFSIVTPVGSAQASLSGEAAPYAEIYAKNADSFWAKRGGFENCPQGVEINWAPAEWVQNSYGSVAAWSILNGCEIFINKDSFRESGPAQRCGVLVHEWGHLIGLQHDPNPKHVMYYRAVVPPSCKHFNRNKKLWILYDLYTEIPNLMVKPSTKENPYE